MKKLLFILPILVFSCNTRKASEHQIPESSAEQPSLQGSCGYLTVQEAEEALGTKLTEPFEAFSDADMGAGCSFAGKDSGGHANFGYVAFGGVAGFEKARAGEKVNDVGDEAYFVNGADALQLWARRGNHYVMVALGDNPRPDACRKLAGLLLKRLEVKPLE